MTKPKRFIWFLVSNSSLPIINHSNLFQILPWADSYRLRQQKKVRVYYTYYSARFYVVPINNYPCCESRSEKVEGFHPTFFKKNHNFWLMIVHRIFRTRAKQRVFFAVSFLYFSFRDTFKTSIYLFWRLQLYFLLKSFTVPFKIEKW